MSDEIILTKIAKLANKQQITCDNNTMAFQYKHKKWILLDNFKQDYKNILHLISKSQETIAESLRVDFAFVCKDEQDLVIVFRNITRSSKKRRTFLDNLNDLLLATVYPNFKDPPSSEFENKVLKTYVTTRLFEALHLKHNENIPSLTNDMQHKLSLPPKFLPTLCEYQKKSVCWLLNKEVNQESFPDFFDKLTAKDNETVVYKHLYSRHIQSEPPKELVLPPGGILADEMGLGKTVEMLALILLNSCHEVNLNPRMETFLKTVMAKRKCVEYELFCICASNSKISTVQCSKCCLWQHQNCVAFYDSDADNDELNTPYLCPNCWQSVIHKYGLLKTKATFIVSPSTIKMQWLSEIKRHVQPSLRVLIYEGVLSGKWINPRQLAEYDIVLTDYNVLRREFYYTQDNISERTTRNKPRSMRANTPILMLNWWRVLLDEAQMVESKTSHVASLVRTIPAINRWAVTGTPIQNSLNDLQPLLQFIGFEAVIEPFIWHQIVNDFVLQHEKNIEDGNEDASCPALIDILQKCMWRTCKTQIASELTIPPQHEVVHRIQFDNLEELFYNEQHEECRSKFLENVLKYSTRMSTITPQVMNMILQPFLKIRQSCTMPVVVASPNANHNFNSQQQKQFLQPQELHDYLKSTNEISCKSELRAMASSHNGLAGLYFLQKKYDEAIKNYEAVLKLAKDYINMNITVDSLLQIHALHNTMQIKSIQQSKFTAINLEKYENQYNQLEWKYLSTYARNLATVKNAYEAALEKLSSEITESFIITMAEGLETLSDNDALMLLQKIHDENTLIVGAPNAKLVELQSTRTLLYVVQLWFNKLSKISNTLQSDIDDLKYLSENVRSRNLVSPAIWRNIMQLVNSVYDCHLSGIREVQKSKKDIERQQKKQKETKKPLCKMCCIRDSINKFECLLFDKIIDKETNETEGKEIPSFEMNLCKLTFNFIKNKHRHLTINIDKNWLYLENLQLVCKRLIKLWIEMEYTIKAYDELNMCKMRITLTDDVEDNTMFKIMQIEIDGRIAVQQNELMSAQNQFTIKLARLKYIRHLEGIDDMGPCPICHLTENVRYAVLECGHHICFSCLKSIRLYDKGSHFKCSICRNLQQYEKINYVSRAKTKYGDGEKIKGDYSSKITYIVRLILKLQRHQTQELEQTDSTVKMEGEKNNVKILIFSQWEPIIQEIALALKENGITYRAQCTPKSIEEFKNSNLGITCLLMPFARGSKGLNLVEATHVFLVEPILNPGEELQAIGRVHRFGQLSETTVHRFIVFDSIEENIYNFINSSSSISSDTTGAAKWEFNNISLSDFENLFSLQTSRSE